VRQVVNKSLLAGLSPCLLAGALDVLYHHPTLAPLHPPLRVKYYGAFVYNGFILLVKVKKTSYEIKHFLPLEMFELIDVTEGESIRRWHTYAIQDATLTPFAIRFLAFLNQAGLSRPSIRIRHHLSTGKGRMGDGVVCCT
jgi:hypothetical protein